MDLGITMIYRETFDSSLSMGSQVLQTLGISLYETHNIIDEFKVRDHALLQLQHAVYQNETQLIETTKQALTDLENLFESDAKSDQSQR